MIKPFVATTLLAFLAPLTAQAAVFLTKEVQPTPGLEGFFTYTVTATSNVGKISAYDFSKRSGVGENSGIVGPLHQGAFSAIFGSAEASSSLGVAGDSRFLFSPDDVLNLLSEESTEFLGSAFTLYGEALHEATPSRSFLQIVTNDPAAVHLSGKIVSRWTDLAADAHVDLVNLALSDIPVGPAPDLASLPLFTPPVKEIPLTIPPVTPPAPSRPIPPVEVPTEAETTEEEEPAPPVGTPLPNPREVLLTPEIQRWLLEFRTSDLPPNRVYPYSLGEMANLPQLSIDEVGTPQIYLSSFQLFDGDSTFDFAGQIPITDRLNVAVAFQNFVGQSTPPVTSVPEPSTLFIGLAAASGLLVLGRKRPSAAA
ncbi:PEP-CTERM sorting domain-containing protein [Aeoliella sp. SH292]|uniref:PEP-CTERM sorting domain-containing protein n=1 Tax=Aeoliella sp. SH292 TaxID=3454464 RepID=UPI003F9E41B3